MTKTKRQVTHIIPNHKNYNNIHLLDNMIFNKNDVFKTFSEDQDETHNTLSNISTDDKSTTLREKLKKITNSIKV